MGRENISPKAIGLLSSHFDGFPSLEMEEIHAGSRCGTLMGSRSGTLTGSTIGVGAGVSSGIRTRRLSGSPISAIELSRVVIGHNELPSLTFRAYQTFVRDQCFCHFQVSPQRGQLPASPAMPTGGRHCV